MKPKHKFNNGNGATICKLCDSIIAVGFFDNLLCIECQKKAIKKFTKEKEQIMNAYATGYANGMDDQQKISNAEDCNIITARDYYNKSFTT